MPLAAERSARPTATTMGTVVARHRVDKRSSASPWARLARRCVLAGATRTASHQRARSMWASPTLRPGRIARSHPLARHAPRPPAMHQEMWLAPSTQIAPSYWSAGWASWGPGEVEQACGQLGPGCHAGCPRRPGRAERGVRAGVWAFRVRVLVTVGPTREANRPRGRAVAAACPQDPAAASARADRAQAAAHWRDT
jgi:hypothetical protein